MDAVAAAAPCGAIVEIKQRSASADWLEGMPDLFVNSKEHVGIWPVENKVRDVATIRARARGVTLFLIVGVVLKGESYE